MIIIKSLILAIIAVMTVAYGIFSEATKDTVKERINKEAEKDPRLKRVANGMGEMIHWLFTNKVSNAILNVGDKLIRRFGLGRVFIVIILIVTMTITAVSCFNLQDESELDILRREYQTVLLKKEELDTRYRELEATFTTLEFKCEHLKQDNSKMSKELKALEAELEKERLTNELLLEKILDYIEDKGTQ